MKSDEISPDEDLVNKWRLAKGDLEVTVNARGKINQAIPVQPTIIKEQIRRKLFPHHYEIYGIAFLELQTAYRAPWAMRKMAGTLEQLGNGLNNRDVDEIYQNVCKVVGIERIVAIQFLLENPERRNYRKPFVGSERRNDRATFYKDSFELLSSVIDSERERLRNLNKIF